MKKLLAAALFVVSASAFAGVPAGYSVAEESDTAVTLVNESKGAVVNLTIVKEQVSAVDAAKQTAEKLACNVEVAAINENVAGFDGCMVDGVSMSVLVASVDGETLIAVGNDKVSDEDIQVILGLK